MKESPFDTTEEFFCGKYELASYKTRETMADEPEETQTDIDVSDFLIGH